MKKQGSKVTRRITFFVLSFVFIISATVYAHSGGTDSKGGHKNHSTGEYHYHHGYAAHQHYDMDGDGDKDCPYTFNGDTTSKGSGSVSSGSSSVNKQGSSSAIKHNSEIGFIDIIIALLDAFMNFWIICIAVAFVFYLVSLAANKLLRKNINLVDRCDIVLVVISALISVGISIYRLFS